MGGGEVARYLGKYGNKQVSKAVFISSIPPFLLKTPDNKREWTEAFSTGSRKGLPPDRPAFLTQFPLEFLQRGCFGWKTDQRAGRSAQLNIGAGASPKGTLDCVSAWLTDFRNDLKKIDVPTLVIHGDSDRILPLSATGKRTPQFVKGSKLVVVEGGPHGLTWTHAEKVNRELLNFLGQGILASQKAAQRYRTSSLACSGYPREQADTLR